MSWCELDDGILDNPKFIRAAKEGGSDAIHLWLGLKCYCSKHLTDGFVPEDMLDEVRGPRSPKARERAMRALMSARLVHLADGGYQMHDYLDWSSSREEVLARRAAARERKQRSRGADTSVRRPSRRDDDVTDAKVPSESPTPARASPLPSPLPLPSPPPLPDPDAGVHEAPSMGIHAKAEEYVRSPCTASMKYGAPETWSEVIEACADFIEVYPGSGELRSRDTRAVTVVERFAQGFTRKQLRDAARGSKLDPHFRNAAFQTVKTIWRDAEQVDRFCALLANPPKPVARGRGRNAPMQIDSPEITGFENANVIDASGE